MVTAARPSPICRPPGSRLIEIGMNYAAPAAAAGELAVTYLDEDLRISRGDKGNLFVLDMADRAARLEGQ